MTETDAPITSTIGSPESTTTTIAVDVSTLPVTGPGTLAAVDWFAAIDATRAVSSGVSSFDLGIRSGVRQSQMSVVSVFDVDNEAGRSLATGDLAPTSEVISIGDTSWISPWNSDVRAAVGYEIEFIEVPTDELVAAGVMSKDPDVNAVPLYFLAGVEHETLTTEGASRRTYKLDLDPDLLRVGMPPEVEEIFLVQMGDFLDPTKVSSLTGTASLDEANRVVVLEVIATINPDLTNGEPTELFFRISNRNLNETVRIEPPDPANVVHIDTLGDLRDTLSGPGPGF